MSAIPITKANLRFKLWLGVCVILSGAASFAIYHSTQNLVGAAVTGLFLTSALFAYSTAAAAHHLWRLLPPRFIVAFITSFSLLVPLTLNTFSDKPLSLWGFGLALYAAPLVVLMLRPPGSVPNSILFLLVLWLWLPIEWGVFDFVVLWPAKQGSILVVLLAMTASITAFSTQDTALKKLFTWNRIGFREAITRGTKEALTFIALGLPFALLTGFVSFDWSAQKLFGFPLACVVVFWLTALPEEWLFRVLLQDRVEGWHIPRLTARIITSVVFGLSHLNNGPTPDWRYAVLATGAGWFYSRAYGNSRNLLAAAVAHTLVDSIWVSCFTSPVH